MKTKHYRIRGTAPLIPHNCQTADPFNHYTKELKRYTKNRGKTDSDFEEIAKIEWFAGLYIKDNKIIIPGANITKMLSEAAKKRKLGKVFVSSVFVGDDPAIEYDGEKDISKLWEDESFRFMKIVTVKTDKVLRCRPIFNEWALEFDVSYFEDSINVESIDQAMKVASTDIGLCDWRPRYGRFVVE